MSTQFESLSTIKGQIVIPAKLRRKYGIKEGTKIILIDAGDSIILKPITEQYLLKLQGSLKGSGAMSKLSHLRNKNNDEDKFGNESP